MLFPLWEHGLLSTGPASIRRACRELGWEGVRGGKHERGDLWLEAGLLPDTEEVLPERQITTGSRPLGPHHPGKALWRVFLIKVNSI